MDTNTVPDIKTLCYFCLGETQYVITTRTAQGEHKRRTCCDECLERALRGTDTINCQRVAVIESTPTKSKLKPPKTKPN